MLCTGAPDKGILETVLQGSVQRVAHIFDGRIVTDNEGFVESRIGASPEREYND